MPNFSFARINHAFCLPASHQEGMPAVLHPQAPGCMPVNRNEFRSSPVAQRNGSRFIQQREADIHIPLPLHTMARPLSQYVCLIQTGLVSRCRLQKAESALPIVVGAPDNQQRHQRFTMWDWPPSCLAEKKRCRTGP